MNTSPSNDPPSRIDRYQIKQIINRGGMAVVFLAYDPNFEREIAIKMLTLENIKNQVDRTRFFREARLVAALEDEAIVPVYDFFELYEIPYLVMRYMPGGSLAERLGHGALPFEIVVQIVLRIAPALDRVHREGIVHRDLKPSNILFDRQGKAYLADFGVAKITEACRMSSPSDLTGEDTIGTTAYMSPEQILGVKDLDGRADIYSLGVILFQMLSGRKPYQADNTYQLAKLHLESPIPSIRVYEPSLPGDVDILLGRAMAKDRESRYSKASQLAADLQVVADAFRSGIHTLAETGVQPLHKSKQPISKTREDSEANGSLASIILQEVCAKCGRLLKSTERPCPDCGEERRLTKS